jgi:prepilin-type N-terminal cleavage/methylation domain-containing protein
MTQKKQAGFTLLEVLLVVAIIAILAGIVILALNPSKQLGDSRNAQRRADVNTVLSAVYQYAIDNNGALPASIASGTVCTVSTQEICKTGGTCTGLSDLSTYLVTTTSKYLVSMPLDPSSTSTNGTGYQIYKNATTNRVTVCSPNAENGVSITATR